MCHRVNAHPQLLTSFKLGHIHRAQTRIEVKVELDLGAGLAIAEASKLFRDHHRDPFDRLRIAQAMVERIPISSVDATLISSFFIDVASGF